MVTCNQTIHKSTQQKNNYLAFPLNLISFTQFVYFFLGHLEQVSQQVCFKTATQKDSRSSKVFTNILEIGGFSNKSLSLTKFRLVQTHAQSSWFL